MKAPSSPHFDTVDLSAAYNRRRDGLAAELAPPSRFLGAHGAQVIRGIPFEFGAGGEDDVAVLDDGPVTIDLGGRSATYVVFVHAVEDRPSRYQDGLADFEVDGLDLGDHVSDYVIRYADGTESATPVLRRFGIQQRSAGWGSAPFATVSAGDEIVLPALNEAVLLGRPLVDPEELGGATGPGRDDLVAELSGYAIDGRIRSPFARGGIAGGSLWLYALPVPRTDQPIDSIVCAPRRERSTIYALTTTQLGEHPLRTSMRSKARVAVPDGTAVDALGARTDIAIDLGTVISVRPALDYDDDAWEGARPVVEPQRSRTSVVVEYHAHPAARLHVGDEAFDVADVDRLDGGLHHRSGTPTIVAVPAAHRPVTLRFVDAESGSPIAVRLHLHGTSGEYLPPRGHHRKVNPLWGHDTAGEFVNLENQYCYVEGECVADLPLGTVFIEALHGLEHRPIRTSFEVAPSTSELVFEHQKVLRWRERGWVSADTHVHFLSPHTARLEASAEGINVTNLLASQWGEMYSNVGDFDGRTTLGAHSVDGTGEHLVRVGTENRMQVLGHIGLLGYSGPMIHPLCTGGPDESAAGDPLEVSMAMWAKRCIDQGGLVVMPHAPFPQLERAADIVLGLVHAIEFGDAMNPFHPDPDHPLNLHISPYGMADWYRYLNLGLRVPLVGGSDKMSAGHLLGGIRCYAQLGSRPLTYDNWMDAIKEGNTFVTIGPLARMQVEGMNPGGVVDLPVGGGALEVEWQIESTRLPIDGIEIVVGGHVAHAEVIDGDLSAAGSCSVDVREPTWIALRTRGSYRGLDEVCAHTSSVQVRVDARTPFSATDAVTVLEQIQGSIAYVDTIATRPDRRRFVEIRASLEAAYRRMHQQMHAAGVYHDHTLHDPTNPHEH